MIEVVDGKEYMVLQAPDPCFLLKLLE